MKISSILVVLLLVMSLTVTASHAREKDDPICEPLLDQREQLLQEMLTAKQNDDINATSGIYRKYERLIGKMQKVGCYFPELGGPEVVWDGATR